MVLRSGLVFVNLLSETDYFIKLINSLSKTDDFMNMIHSLGETADFIKNDKFFE